MDNRFIGLIIGLVVGVLMIGSLLVPTINDATTTEKTFTNDGYYFMKEIDTSTSSVITWDYSAPSVLIVDDVAVELPQSSYFPATIVCSETWGLRYIVSASDTSLTLFDNAKSTQFTASVNESAGMEITISGGTATFVSGTNTKTESFTDGYCIAKSGDYVMKKSTDSAYLNGDSIIYSTGRTGGLSALSSSTVSIHIDGSIDDGITATSLWPDTYTTSNVTINYSEVSGYIDLYSFQSAQFDVTDTSSHTATATYSQVIVPTKVTAELSDHLDTGEIAMIAVIPVLMIASLLIFAVRFVTRD